MLVGVAVPEGRVPRWQHEAIAALRAIDGLRVNVVALPGWRTWAPRWAGPVVAVHPIALEHVDLDACDVVLDLTDNDLATAAPLGTWSFRLGARRSRVPFAHEIASSATTVEVALVRRRGEICEVLRRGRFPIPMWYPRLLRGVLLEAARWPALAAVELRNGIDRSNLDRVSAHVEESTARVRFATALARRFADGVRDAFFTVDRWNVGVAVGDARALLSGEPLRVRWLPNSQDRTCLADPFVVERGGKRVLFAESFSDGERPGVIDALTLDDDDRVVERVRALEGAAHFSFPYPVEIDGELYLLPETCARREAALYRCVRFPDHWERARALLPFDAVDTTLFAYDGRWWTFCTRSSRGESIALHAFYADDPWGAWRAHALNPIVIDVAGARPAGAPFVVDGVLYRPAQDCSRTYGGAVVIARVDVLEPAAYRETVVSRLDPVPGPFPDGIHTVGVAGRTIVVDGKRRLRAPRNVGRVLAAALKRGRASGFSPSCNAGAPQDALGGGLDRRVDHRAVEDAG